MELPRRPPRRICKTRPEAMTLLKSGRAPVRHYAGHEGVIKPALPAPRQTNAASSFCPCRVVAYRLIARPCSRRRRARASRSARFSAPGAADETANLVWSSPDSALEGDEFELSVPGRTGKLNTSWPGWVLSGRTDQSRGVQGMRPHSVSSSS
jgi:hypothetical protein